MIEKSALLLTRGVWPESELLLVREHGKEHWLFPGGKREAGESRQDALIREVREELSVGVTEFGDLGTIEGHTPDGRPLRMSLFRGSVDAEPSPSGEIAALFWLRRSEIGKVHSALTPITLQKVFPLLETRQIW